MHVTDNCFQQNMISNPYTIYYVLHTSVIYTITPQYTNILSFRFYTYLKKKLFRKQDRIRFKCIQVVDHYISLHGCTHESCFMNEQSGGPLSSSLSYTQEYFTLFPIVFLYRRSNSTVHKTSYDTSIPVGMTRNPFCIPK